MRIKQFNGEALQNVQCIIGTSASNCDSETRHLAGAVMLKKYILVLQPLLLQCKFIKKVLLLYTK